MNRQATATRILILTIAMFCMAASIAYANVTLSPIFSSHMVLQREKPIPVYGTASAGEVITVTFNSQSQSTTADAQGNWRVNLPSMVAKTTGGNMTIVGNNTITITDVVIGDVWVCSGQSNMEWRLYGCDRQTEDVATANYPGIRSFYVPAVWANDPTKSTSGNWTVCSPSTAANFGAVGFYFARKIQQALGSAIPIGLFQAPLGATAIDPWLAPEGCSDVPTLQPLYSQNIIPYGPFSLFNGTIYPIAPYGVKGAIWYQGESRETTYQTVDSYFLKEKALVEGWKRVWGMDDFPMYIVLIANYTNPPSGTNVAPDMPGTSWADTRIQQMNVLGIPHNGVASAIDVGEAGDIHPKDKLDVGERLALWALKNDYGQSNVVPSGPVLNNVTVSGNKAICTFDYVGAGLMVGSKTPYLATTEVVGGTLARFSIAGASGSWYDATAVINGSTVELSSPSVPTPAKVAYACWTNPSGANLYNRDGLPAAPFYVDAISAKYTVTATAGTGGTISPAGVTTYLKRKTAYYTITPDSGYYIQNVTVDGVSVGAGKTYSFDPLYANHTINATFTATAPTYTINASSNAGGTITSSGATTVTQGNSQSYTAVPNAGCQVATMTVDGVPVGNRTSFTFANVRANHTISITFSCKLTASPGYGGSISPAGTTLANYGSNKTFTIAANTGFTLADVKIDGASVGAVTSYTFTNITTAHTISATFGGGEGSSGYVPRIYDLLFSCNTDALPASGNTGNWATYIPSGKTLTAIASPTAETLSGLKWEKNLYADGDGYDCGTYSLPINCVGATIVVAVKPTRNAVSSGWNSCVDAFYDRLVIGVKNDTGMVCVRRNGSLETSTTAIPDGQITILSLVVQPTGQYKVYANGVKIMDITSTSDMTSIVPGVAGTYANKVTLGRNWPDAWTTYNGYIGDVFFYTKALTDAERLQLEAGLTTKFTGSGPTSYTVTASAGAGGSISPSGAVTVNSGANQTFTITPNSGYSISGVTVDGGSVGAVSSYTFNNVTANHTISATFTNGSTTTYTVTASAGAGGSISPTGALSVNSGANQTFSITPNSGYSISGVTVDGSSVGAVASYTFSNVTANHTISATFVSNPTSFTITASAGAGGSISPTGAVTVSSGASQTFTITPNSGYIISGVSVDGDSVGAVGTYTFSNVTLNHTISATFLSSTGGVPRTDQLYGSWITDSLPASGVINSWASYIPTGLTFTKMGSATVATIDGVKWERSISSTLTDGFDLGNFSTWPCNGASFVMAIKPVRIATADAWTSLFDIGCMGLTVGVRNNTGGITVYRKGTQYEYTTGAAIIPDGQKTILSCIFQEDGTFKIYANGALIVNNTNTTDANLPLNPVVPWYGGTPQVNNWASHINLGRTNGAGWSVFNGYIGDTYIYKVALTDAERLQLETQLANKFINYAITASAGAGGTITPSGAVAVAPGGSQTFSIAPNSGYAIDSVTVDGIDQGGISSYTLNNVIANHTISATFKLAEKPIGVNNKAALTDSKLEGRSVKVWGKVKSINGTVSFVISDGFTSDVTIMLNGIAPPAANKTVVVTGNLGADKTIQAQTVVVYP